MSDLKNLSNEGKSEGCLNKGCLLGAIGFILLCLGIQYPFLFIFAIIFFALYIAYSYLNKTSFTPKTLLKANSLEKENTELKAQIENLKNQLTPEQIEMSDINTQIDAIKKQLGDLKSDLEYKTEEKSALESELSRLKKEIDLGNLELDYHEIGLYKPVYDLMSSNAYKEELQNIRTQQKTMVKNSEAVSGGEGFTMNGSLKEGEKVIKDNKKQLLRMFNNECTVLIDKVKYNNYDSILSKIQKSFTDLNKMNERLTIKISHEYLKLKITELRLAYEYSKKKQEEKEIAREERERLKEEAKLQREIEEAKKAINKEKKHYSSALENIEEKLLADPSNSELLSKKKELLGQLEEIEKNLEDIDYREANKRAGYVYVISNIGSFGENIYKIGMTRRLDPMERVYELGDASVPFNFDVHAMIFSDDAPGLETALHNAFDDKKVNMINTRREFFNVTLEEIEEVVKANYDKTVDFVKNAEAEQYRESLMIRENA